MKKYWKVWDAYSGFNNKKEKYETLSEAQDAAKLRASNIKGDYDVVIFEAVGKVKIPVPNMEIEMYT